MLPSCYCYLLSLCFALTSVASSVTSIPNGTSSADVVVTIKNGSYIGTHNSAFNQDFFLGIPYAQPPIDDLRFRVPQSLNSSWSIHTATEWPPFCVGYGRDNTGHEMSEDCLYLNIFRPCNNTSNSSSLPVAVWIHGGGLFMGGTDDRRYNLSFIIDNSVDMGKPMIGISLQYRLSGWGFLGGKEALEGGATNLGFRDQRLALHWIQENIDAFGGDPSKVTIWGESAGAQSVGAQFLAYNGRDDNLFRAGIAESGGPAVSFFPATLPGGYNSTTYQDVYDSLVSNTSCLSSLDSGSSLSCLRSLPFSDLNAALNTSADGYGPFVPIIDNDFIATYPSVQLSTGNFVRAPLLIGANTDEGTSFGINYGPNGTGVNSDEEWLDVLNSTNIASDSQTASTLSYLYPNIQGLGIPNLATWPWIIPPDSNFSSQLGSQFRRLTSYFGDTVVIAPRRATNQAWSTYSVPSYAYRFDVVVNGVPTCVGSTHFQEVAFVFNNLDGEGYAINPFGNMTADDNEKFVELSNLMSRSWVSFISDLDPNNHRIEAVNTTWPVYNATEGGGLGINMVFTVNVTQRSYIEWDSWRGEGIAFINENALEVYGL
ncbi:alpha/beta-hydrolase [Hyaloscypha variabilis F]|uniref:Carboxylic ester hydrolase n=1 Tax=Hyaloscypha variabilis (strain UAMH 11265 / GT02V1 / F) TaxID=1149755 RepID=A0A2J6RF43_HYAVF|nr:alpha/beta-hydrolase [Hyaloscypha variabilis F]